MSDEITEPHRDDKFLTNYQTLRCFVRPKYKVPRKYFIRDQTTECREE